MKQHGLIIALLATLLLAGCGPQPRARIPSSGVTAASGGGEVELHNDPIGTTNLNGL